MLNTLFLLAAATGTATFASRTQLEENLQTIAATSDGRVGICALDQSHAEPVCVRGTEAFPLQSVMKFIVAAVVLDRIDQGAMKLNDTITIRSDDYSPGPEDFIKFVRTKGEYAATLEELMRRAIVESDSTSVDVLLKHIGGLAVVQGFLGKHQIKGIRIDRNERDLQADFSGLRWQNALAAPGAFDAAVKKLQPKVRDAALEAYLKDPRDTAAPAAMVKFLKNLAAGLYLSPASTQKIIAIMEQTVTGKDRLKAGLPQAWTIAHKTGTSGTWAGRAATVNDVGLLRAPDGSLVAIAVFVADSRQKPEAIARIFSQSAQAVTQAVQRQPQKS